MNGRFEERGTQTYMSYVTTVEYEREMQRLFDRNKLMGKACSAEMRDMRLAYEG